MTVPRAADGRLDSRPLAEPSGEPFPPGRTTLELGTSAQAVLAVPPGDPVPRPLLVFCHGAGGSAADSLAEVGELAADRGALVLAPSSTAFTWDLVAGGPGRDIATIDAALAQVFARTAVDRVAIGGFSDGASYALSLGIANGDLADAVLAFSPGFAAPPGRHGRPRFWIAHGTDDRVLPVARCGRRVAAELAADGYVVTYDEFAGGHDLPPRLVSGALRWWLDGPRV
ncbi:alpha/beta hydrolase [Modestobacter roseus]|uniref:Putative esterase n=1 Tax=Modestobacter roseus TaxID=1181884 RepID=A0A562IVV5_9ACTN|nr:phospholipase [Modestobacter roseus]MQA32877.1 phospholipase [Modestobacter roseus]TWH74674.1 putative esterase [Modestobacter roseus]